MFRRFALAMVVAGCGVSVEGELEPEVLDAAQAQSELGVDVLNLVPLDTDLPSGDVETRVARLFTDAASARAFFGNASPQVTYTRNWVVAFRPANKTQTSRVTLTRAQLSASGATLSVWATITEPGAGCAAWQPNEVAVGRVPSRAVKPSSVRVYITNATSACGVVLGPQGCAPDALACAAPTPFCSGTYQRADGSWRTGTCVALPAYEGTSTPCTNDAACGEGGICAGLSSGFGLCQPAWMRGTYSMPQGGQLSAPLPQGGAWHRTLLEVRGQSTVPMDAWVQVFVDGLPASRVEWRLTNPIGTVSTTVRGGPFAAKQVAQVPGDEPVNGEWWLEVRDVGAGAVGHFRGARLSVTSRWD